MSLHINQTILLPQYTKLYIPLTVENYCFLTAGQDVDAAINLLYNTATAEPATPFLPPAADAHLWHFYSLTELHTSTSHINHYILVTISLLTDYVHIQQLLTDNDLDYFARDYISHSTSSQSHYTHRLNHSQGACLINYNFNNFSQEYLNYISEPATVQSLLELRQSQRDYGRNNP